MTTTVISFDDATLAVITRATDAIEHLALAVGELAKSDKVRLALELKSNGTDPGGQTRRQGEKGDEQRMQDVRGSRRARGPRHERNGESGDL